MANNEHPQLERSLASVVAKPGCFLEGGRLSMKPGRSCLQVEPGKPGAEVSKTKNISQRKNLPIECAQGDQPLRCPNRVF